MDLTSLESRFILANVSIKWKRIIFLFQAVKVFFSRADLAGIPQILRR